MCCTHIGHSEKVLVMRVFIAILVLIFSLQSLTKADEVSEIIIEGLSVGDSALNFFTKEDIKNNTFDYYKIKSFVPVQMDKFDFFKTYDAVDFSYRRDDSKYIITGLNGILLIADPIECEKKLDKRPRKTTFLRIKYFF